MRRCGYDVVGLAAGGGAGGDGETDRTGVPAEGLTLTHRKRAHVPAAANTSTLTQKTWSDKPQVSTGVRRQGLESRTRGLNSPVLCSYSRHHKLRLHAISWGGVV